MKKNKIMSIMIVMLLVSALILTGCTKTRSTKEVLKDVFANEVEITSAEGKIEMSLNVNMEGFDVTTVDDPQMLIVMNMLNNLKITMNYATDLELEKSAIDFNADMGGMSFSGKIFTYDEKIAIHMPFLTQFLGDPRLASGYIVMSLEEIAEMQGSTLNISDTDKTKELVMSLINSIISELDDKALSNNGSSTIEVGGQSVKVDEIQIDIGKEEIKSIALTTINLLEDKDFRDLVFEMAQAYDPFLSRQDFDEELDSLNSAEATEEINNALEEIGEIIDFNKTGIKTQLFIDKNDNVIRTIMKMSLAINDDGEAFEVTFNVTDDKWNINKPVTIDIPDINESNSLDLFEILFGGFLGY
ncbi:hypothetical protein [Alkaliphilus peptidifermentans]|uniref:Uncharacterized protein n=1 Tax=Alkaliphilus peptidifermentans DSM 18978 TaxID=1120976 RepID=A0A1G5CHP0_9FIRM|nr:hypothetical protein [Alkaliphilus peptidifermentans]SCY01837.1 hypothetical protein SAMN03080606_00665 [Alkaliphilus peptidifermentans DSM 18978]